MAAKIRGSAPADSAAARHSELSPPRPPSAGEGRIGPTRPHKHMLYVGILIGHMVYGIEYMVYGKG